MSHLTVTPSTKANSIEIEQLYEDNSLGGIQAYTANGYTISTTNKRDIVFETNYADALSTKRFYFWPRFKACVEYVETDMCGSLEQTEDIWIYGKALMFDL